MVRNLTYHPIETVEPADMPGINEARVGERVRTSCPRCAKLFRGTALSQAQAFAWCKRAASFKRYVERCYRVAAREELIEWSIYAAHCDHCHHVWFWSQADKPDAQSGGPMTGPLILCGRHQVDYLLKQMPELAGVSQS